MQLARREGKKMNLRSRGRKVKKWRWTEPTGVSCLESHLPDAQNVLEKAREYCAFQIYHKRNNTYLRFLNKMHLEGALITR